MSLFQTLGVIKTRLQALTWGTEPVFASDSVFVTTAPDPKVYTTYRSPLALIIPGGSVSDSQVPGLLTQQIVIRIVVTNSADARGEASLMGANRVGVLDSRGKGLLEIETEVLAAFELRDGTEGLDIEFKAASATKAALMEGKLYVVVRDYEFSTLITSAVT